MRCFKNFRVGSLVAKNIPNSLTIFGKTVNKYIRSIIISLKKFHKKKLKKSHENCINGIP